MKGQRLSTNAVLGQNMCYIYSRIRNLGQKMRFGNILLEGFWKHTLLARMNSFPISPALFPSRSTLSTTLHLFPEGQKTLWLLQETVKSDMRHCSASARPVDLLCGNLSLGGWYYGSLTETGISASVMMQNFSAIPSTCKESECRHLKAGHRIQWLAPVWGEPWLPGQHSLGGSGQQGCVARQQTQEDIIHRRDEFRVYAPHDKHISYWKVISQGRLSLRKGTASQGHVAVRMAKDEGVRALTVVTSAPTDCILTFRYPEPNNFMWRALEKLEQVPSGRGYLHDDESSGVKRSVIEVFSCKFVSESRVRPMHKVCIRVPSESTREDDLLSLLLFVPIDRDSSATPSSSLLEGSETNRSTLPWSGKGPCQTAPTHIPPSKFRPPLSRTLSRPSGASASTDRASATVTQIKEISPFISSM